MGEMGGVGELGAARRGRRCWASVRRRWRMDAASGRGLDGLDVDIGAVLRRVSAALS